MVPSNEVQGKSLFLVISSQKGGRKMETLIWRIITKYLKKLEEFKIQSVLQVDKTSKTMNWTRI